MKPFLNDLKCVLSLPLMTDDEYLFGIGLVTAWFMVALTYKLTNGWWMLVSPLIFIIPLVVGFITHHNTQDESVERFSSVYHMCITLGILTVAFVSQNNITLFVWCVFMVLLFVPVGICNFIISTKIERQQTVRRIYHCVFR